MLNTFNNQKAQIKTSLRQHYRPTRRRLQTPNVGKDEEQTELSYTGGGSVLGIILRKNICKFLLKLNSQLSYGLEIPPLSIYLGKMKIYVQTKPAHKCPKQFHPKSQKKLETV